MKLFIDEKTYYAKISTSAIGYAGESNSRTIKISQPKIEEASAYYLRFQLQNNTIFDLIIKDDSVILPPSIIKATGKILCQWIAKNRLGTWIAKSNILHLNILPSIDGDISALPTVEEIHTQYETLKSEIESAKSSALQEISDEKNKAINNINSTGNAIIQQIQSNKGEEVVINNINYQDGFYTFYLADNRMYRLVGIQQENNGAYPAISFCLPSQQFETCNKFHCTISMKGFSIVKFQSNIDNLTGDESLTIIQDGVYALNNQCTYCFSIWWDGFGYRYTWYRETIKESSENNT
ncbi:MAG: hypothetical protein IJZ64_05030 [Ruminococcus sp.]|nr:hypothetical protein [Ruminococcus sp.]